MSFNHPLSPVPSATYLAILPRWSYPSVLRVLLWVFQSHSVYFTEVVVRPVFCPLCCFIASRLKFVVSSALTWISKVCWSGSGWFLRRPLHCLVKQNHIGHYMLRYHRKSVIIVTEIRFLTEHVSSTYYTDVGSYRGKQCVTTGGHELMYVMMMMIVTSASFASVTFGL